MAGKREIKMRRVLTGGAYGKDCGKVRIYGDVEDGPVTADGRQVVATMTTSDARKLAIDLLKQAEECDEYIRGYQEKWGRHPNDPPIR